MAGAVCTIFHKCLRPTSNRCKAIRKPPTRSPHLKRPSAAWPTCLGATDGANLATAGAPPLVPAQLPLCWHARPARFRSRRQASGKKLSLMLLLWARPEVSAGNLRLAPGDRRSVATKSRAKKPSREPFGRKWNPFLAAQVRHARTLTRSGWQIKINPMFAGRQADWLAQICLLCLPAANLQPRPSR